MVERSLSMREVGGSTPPSSTYFSYVHFYYIIDIYGTIDIHLSNSFYNEIPCYSQILGLSSYVAEYVQHIANSVYTYLITFALH